MSTATVMPMIFSQWVEADFADFPSTHSSQVLWFWEFDRGGPGARAEALVRYPDFLFPQMQDEHMAQVHWHPNFFDYLYMSFTNASAFSPTDVLPLTRWAKMLMLVQSVTSLLTVGLVVARAVNILH